LLLQLCSEPLHLFLERFPVVFGFLHADVAARCEDVAVRADVVERGGFAEAGDVLVGRVTPCVPTAGRGLPALPKIKPDA